MYFQEKKHSAGFVIRGVWVQIDIDTRMTNNIKSIIIVALLLIFWANGAAQKKSFDHATVLHSGLLPASTTDTNHVFSKNYVNGIAIWNEFYLFITNEWDPHFTNTDLKLDTLYERLPISKFYLENAHHINKTDTNTIIALVYLNKELCDTISYRKYLEIYKLHTKTGGKR